MNTSWELLFLVPDICITVAIVCLYLLTWVPRMTIPALRYAAMVVAMASLIVLLTKLHWL